MKKTPYITMTKWNMSSAYCEYRRVWEDEEGNRYLRINGEFKRLDDMPCADYLIMCDYGE